MKWDFIIVKKIHNIDVVRLVVWKKNICERIPTVVTSVNWDVEDEDEGEDEGDDDGDLPTIWSLLSEERSK